MSTKKFPYRIGFGVDVHQLVENRPLIIGGVQIPSAKGALGHSDADVLIHAICDALLGAASLGDIGVHFPDNDPQYRDIDSTHLLKNVVQQITELGFELGNLDATVMLEAPKISAYIPEMKRVLAPLLKCEFNQISIKATTEEGMGYVGEGKGIKAYCTLILCS